MRSVAACALAALLLILAPVVNANEYSFDSSYADALSAEVECFLSKAWVPLEAFASAFKMDFPTDPRADSPWQVDDNVTKELLFYTFRPTESKFDAMFAGFKNGKFFQYDRVGKVRKPMLYATQDENATCGGAVSSHCTMGYKNSTSPLNGAIVGPPSSIESYNCNSRPWYVGAEEDTENGGTFWTGAYLYSGGDQIGITAAQQLLSSSGSFLGVVGMDITLEQLTSILSGDFMTTDDDIFYYDDDDVDEPVYTAFIVDTDGDLVATSMSGYAFRNSSRVPAVNCSYKTVADAARVYGSSSVGGYTNENVQTYFDRNARLHWVRSTAYEDAHGLEWYILLTQRVDCPSNYAADNSSAACGKCSAPYTAYGGYISTSCYDICINGYYMDDGGECVECKQKGLQCDSVGVTIATLQIKSGWYRFSDRTGKIYECPYPGHCIGNSTCSDASYGGEFMPTPNPTPKVASNTTLAFNSLAEALCATCRPDHYFNSDKERCISCDNYSPTGSDIFVFIVMFFVFVLVSFVIFVKLCSSYVSPSMRRALTERFSNTFVFPEDLDELYNLADGQAVGSTEHVAHTRISQDAEIKQLEGFYRVEKKVKTLFAYFQLVSGFAFNLDMSFPEPFAGVVDALKFLNVDIFTVLPLTCSFEASYRGSLVASTLTPLLFALTFLGFHTYQHFHTKFVDRSRFFFQGFLLILYVVLPSTSSKCFAVFRCSEYEVSADGDVAYYMAVDHSIDCSSTRYKAVFTVAVVFILVYPVGVPLLFGVLLWRDRHELMSPEVLALLAEHKSEGMTLRTSEGRREIRNKLSIILFSAATRGKGRYSLEDPEADSNWAKVSANHKLSFLIGPYERRVYWYEVIECYRRLSLSGLLVIFGAGSTRQIVIGTFLALFYIRVGAYYNAQRADEDDTLNEICNWQLFLILYMCLLIRLGAAPEYVGAILLFILVCSFAVVLLVVLAFGLKKIQRSFTTYWNDNIKAPQRPGRPGQTVSLSATKGDDGGVNGPDGADSMQPSEAVFNENPMRQEDDEETGEDARNESSSPNKGDKKRALKLRLLAKKRERERRGLNEMNDTAEAEITGNESIAMDDEEVAENDGDAVAVSRMSAVVDIGEVYAASSAEMKAETSGKSLDDGVDTGLELGQHRRSFVLDRAQEFEALELQKKQEAEEAAVGTPTQWSSESMMRRRSGSPGVG